MSTATLDGVAALLADAGASPIPPVHGRLPVHMLNRPVDIYRIYLADILANLLRCDTKTVFDSIQSPNNLPHGDLTLPVPRLRLKGKKPSDQCIDLAAEFPPTGDL